MYFDGKMQRVVGGISHHECRRLYGQFASSTNFIRLANQFNDKTFQRFANGLKVGFRTLLPKFIQILLILKAMKSVSLCILSNESYCLCYRT